MGWSPSLSVKGGSSVSVRGQGGTGRGDQRSSRMKKSPTTTTEPRIARPLFVPASKEWRLASRITEEEEGLSFFNIPLICIVRVSSRVFLVKF